MKITKYETHLPTFKFFKKTENISFDNNLNDLERNLIIIYPEITYQEVIGFGGAFTESAGYCFSKLPEAVKNRFYKGLFF